MKVSGWLYIDDHIAQKSIPPNIRGPLCMVDLNRIMSVSFTDFITWITTLKVLILS